MYNNPYMYNQNYNQQSINERIDNQIAQLQQMKEQMKHQQPTSINQTFQLAPQQNGMRFANSLDDVIKEIVYGDTPYFSKDMSVVWIKNSKNEIKTYELNEIMPKDDKDIKIDFLLAQIEELKKGLKKDEPHDTINEPITKSNEDEEPTNVSNVSKSSKKSK